MERIKEHKECRFYKDFVESNIKCLGAKPNEKVYKDACIHCPLLFREETHGLEMYGCLVPDEELMKETEKVK